MDGRMWVCRSAGATGYGCTWQNAWDEWNGQITSHRREMTIPLHTGAPTHV